MADMTPSEWIRQMLEANREGLKQVPFPPGMFEFVEELVRQGNTDEIVALMKLGFIIGVQQGSGAADQTPTQPPGRIMA